MGSSIKLNNKEDIKQIEYLLHNFPISHIDIVGVILDYIGKTSSTLDQVFNKNTKIFDHLFLKPEGLQDGRLLLKTICANRTVCDQLKIDCKHIFTKVVEVIDEIDIINASKQENLMYPNDEVANYLDSCKMSDFVKIWQLSDLHFGKLNIVEPDPYELASTLINSIASCKFISPDIITVTGDLTSKGFECEFDDFVKFAEFLSKEIWGEFRPQRFLVIPGNHDTQWQPDYTNDKFELFKKKISCRSDLFVTPFGEKTQTYEKDKVLVERFNDGNERVPPFAVIKFNDFNVNFLLLVSCFHSGVVPENIRSVFAALEDMDTKVSLEEILRLDKGTFSKEFITSLSRDLETDKTDINIALTHHNLRYYGAHQNANKHAPLLLKTLYMKHFNYVFHGHVHLIETNKDMSEPPKPGHAFSIPCSSLSSHCFAGAINGFNIHLVSKDIDNKSLVTLFCPVGIDESFNPSEIKPCHHLKDW